ncbi:MAG: hypothetical protein HKN76_01910 [Saprospiraceae bacterium]|nr:hypothetical protein [Saprospiraceae bacterium]
MIFNLFLSILIALSGQHIDSSIGGENASNQQTVAVQSVSPEFFVLEPWIYREDFEDRDLGAWASYPLWQDIAYNQNFRVNEIMPRDPNISIVQKVTPYTAVHNYAGAQKLLDMYLIPGATLSFRYYLKTNQTCEWYKVRFAAGEYGKLDVDLANIKLNSWQQVTITYSDLIRENPAIAGKDKIQIFALAHLAKFPDADPDMPIYFGLDDVVFSAARPAPFKFIEPQMHKLPEFKTYIPARHYRQHAEFNLSGQWMKEAEQVSLDISVFSDTTNHVFRGNLSQVEGQWHLEPMQLDFPNGLFLATLKAYDDVSQIGQTAFSIHITPGDRGGHHPRLLFDSLGREELGVRFREEKFRDLATDMAANAQAQRLKIPPESLVYDLDQFPDEDWLATWDAWGSRIYHTGEALRLNARAYTFQGDQEAGLYVKEVLLRLATWPDWTHPWQTKRGRFSEHRTGSWAHRVAEAYDLVYHLFTPEERELVCSAIMKNIVKGVHRTYIYNDNITAATSNWLAMTVGGSLMCLSAIFEDVEETKNIEPYFTGAILKLNRFLHHVTDSKDGGWGEGFGYNNYSFSNLSYSLPSLENVFNVDLSAPLTGTYNEYIWAGLIKSKRWFEYGDSHGHLTSAKNWAYLLNKSRDPRLSWFYHFLNDHSTNYVANAESPYTSAEKQRSRNYTYEDILFNTSELPQKDPFDENPVKVFRDLGTVVFKGGWDSDDFVFVMRSGPAYNHQHMDQGSIWLADQGNIFVEERPLGNSDYYDDPLYESWLTQPVGHSTILIDGNQQSQRVGDHLHFAPGFDDYAFISHFLDGKHAAFVTGDIGRLYWSKVNQLRRNVLYLKPGVVLMLDVAFPGEKDVDVTLLYQTAFLKDIQAGEKRSSILKNNHAMHMFHLAPEQLSVEAVETPHYLKTLRNVRPLQREGMLTITARTDHQPLVMANLITSSEQNDVPELIAEAKSRFVHGVVEGHNFAFTTHPGDRFEVEEFVTDALAVTWNDDKIFVAKAKNYSDKDLGLTSDQLITFELSMDGSLQYYVHADAVLTLKFKKRRSNILANGKSIERSSNELVDIPLSKGTGLITFN